MIKVNWPIKPNMKRGLIGKDDRTDLALIKLRRSGGNLPLCQLVIESDHVGIAGGDVVTSV
jgi:S1-C subfamily serine protease